MTITDTTMTEPQSTYAPAESAAPETSPDTTPPTMQTPTSQAAATVALAPEVPAASRLAAPAPAIAAVEAAKAAKPTFAALGLASGLLKALDEEGYTTPTPIQAQSIPSLLAGRDLLGLAETGTGKTAAFSLPILQMLKLQDRKTIARSPRALILAPTRELTIQIGESLDTYGRHLTLTHAVIFGGVGSRPQMKAMDRGVDIVVATPGRLLDLISTKHINLDQITHFVLDEADRMLDMGFIHDVRRVVRLLPKSRQSLLFSATMPDDIASLAADLLRNPVRVEIERAGKTVDRIDQRVHFVGDKEKRAALVALLQDAALQRVIVFTRTKRGANRVARTLEAAGIGAHAIHGNKSQNARQAALEAFKGGDARVLVATDIAARGIDIDDISHVINYELPNIPESYVHRIGRTARAGANGIAIALCAPDERPYLRDIERLTKKKLEDAGAIAGIEKYLKMPEPRARKDEDDDEAPTFERGARRIETARRNNRPYETRPEPTRERAGAGERRFDRPQRGDGHRDEGRRDDARGDRPRFDRPHGHAPRGEGRPTGDRPQGFRPQGARPQGDRPQGARPFDARRGPGRPGFERDGERGDRKPFQAREPRPAPRSEEPRPAAKPFDPLDVNSRRTERLDGERRHTRQDGERRHSSRPDGERPRFAREDRPHGDRDRGERRPWTNRPDNRGGDRRDGERRPWENRSNDRGGPDRAPRRDGDRPAGRNADGERKPWQQRPAHGQRTERGPGERGQAFRNRDGADRKPRDQRFADRKPGERKPWVDRRDSRDASADGSGDRPRPRGPRPDRKPDGDTGTNGA